MDFKNYIGACWLSFETNDNGLIDLAWQKIENLRGL